jgi:RNA polymerase sigma-70 factor (ECF subfamily)
MRTDDLQMTANARRDVDAAARLADFDRLYEQHAAFVWRTLRSLGVSKEDIEDTAQDVFTTVFRKLGTFEGRSSLRTWLCGITVAVARNHTRKRHRREGLGVPAAPPATPSASESTEALDLVSRCLADLDDGLRMVFILAELEKLTAPEIAEVLALNVNTVYSRLRLARERFEASLERHGGPRP